MDDIFWYLGSKSAEHTEMVNVVKSQIIAYCAFCNYCAYFYHFRSEKTMASLKLYGQKYAKK